ncbi:MAG: TIR domain-containing protein [Chitinophagales bacterium]
MNTTTNNNSEVKVFFTYAPEDDALRQELDDFLAILKRNAWLTTFDMGQISVGSNIESSIEQYINEADLIIPLISSDFLASDHNYEVQLQHGIERHNAGEALLLPVLLRPCLWQFSVLSEFAVLPKNKQPIESSKWSNREEAFAEVAMGIKEAIDQQLGKKTAQQKTASNTTSQTQKAVQATNKYNRYPYPHDLFVGRKKELQQFEEALKEARVIAIEGLGGVGKTEFIAKCIEDYIPNKENIIWLSITSATTFDLFIEGAGYGHLLMLQHEGSNSLFAALLDCLEKDSKVIFWDNYQDLQDQTFIQFLNYANRFIQQCEIILISRFRTKQLNVVSIKIEGLSKEDALVYAQNLYQHRAEYAHIDPAVLPQICKNLNGHPLAIELAIQVASYGENVENISAKLIEYRGIDKVDEVVHKVFMQVLEHPSTTQAERDLLGKISLFENSVQRSVLQHLNDRNIFQPLYQLIDKFVVHPVKHLPVKEPHYDAHRIVKDLVYEMLSDKVTLHQKALAFFLKQRTKKIDLLLEANIFHHAKQSQSWKIILSTLLNHGEEMINRGHCNLAQKMVLTLTEVGVNHPMLGLLNGRIAFFKTDWKTCQIIFERCTKEKNLYVKCTALWRWAHLLLEQENLSKAAQLAKLGYDLAKNSSNTLLIAETMNTLGVIFLLQKKLPNAKKIFEKAYKIAQNQATGLQLYPQILGNISKVHKELGNVVQAHLFLKKAIAKCEIQGETYQKAIHLSEMGNLHAEMLNMTGEGAFDKAMACYEKAYATLEGLGDQLYRANVAQSIAALCSQKVDAKQNQIALKYYNQSLAIFQKLELPRQITATYINMSSLYYTTKAYDTAINYAKQGAILGKKLIDQTPTGQAYFYLGLSHQGAKNYQEALNAFQAALTVFVTLKDFNRQYYAYILIAKLFALDNIKKYDHAVKNFLYAIAIAQHLQMPVFQAKAKQLLHKLSQNALSIDQLKQLVKEQKEQINPTWKGFLPDDLI